MRTYLEIAFWTRVVLLPIAIGVVVWGIVVGLPMLVVAGLLLLGSSALMLVPAIMRRRQEAAARR